MFNFLLTPSQFYVSSFIFGQIALPPYLLGMFQFSP